MAQTKSMIRNCITRRKLGETYSLFLARGAGKGDMEVHLDGYAIIPIEEYQRDKALADMMRKIQNTTPFEHEVAIAKARKGIDRAKKNMLIAQIALVIALAFTLLSIGLRFHEFYKAQETKLRSEEQVHGKATPRRP